MPVSVVVGAQYGSEGKGKVSYDWALRREAIAAVRVGGPNSGHTVVTEDGKVSVLQQLPTPALLPGVISVLPPGAYIRLDVLRNEIEQVGAGPSTLIIDPRAVIVTDKNVEDEQIAQLHARIGSTASGTGAAVVDRIRRDGSSVRARDIEWLAPYLADTLPQLRDLADRGRIVVEGTQGYGLSILHGSEGDYATSRDTTAAGFLSETGLSPMDVDEVVMVARAFPIRVAGNSGPLRGETTWREVGAKTGHEDLLEFTTVTHRVRRVGEFDPEVVTRAIAANKPTHVVLNHVDYVGPLNTEQGREAARDFVENVERALGRKVDFVGTSRSELISRDRVESAF